MKDKFKIIILSTVIALMLLCIVGGLVFMYPFILVQIAYSQVDRTKSLDYFEKAISYSYFRPQKEYTIEAIMPSLLLTKRYDDVIEYYKIYENVSSDKSFMSPVIITLAAQAYFQKEDYKKALELGEKSNNQHFIAKVCVKTKDYKRAMEISESILKSDRPSRNLANLYIAQVQMAEGKWQDANESVNKVIEISPENIDALRCKTEIAKKLGNESEYNKYSNKLNQVEEKRNKWIKEK